MYTRYIALGDSISIDLYPALDLAGVHEWPLTGDPRSLSSGLGAASLFHRNALKSWPDFAGRDLSSLMPGIAFRNHRDLAGPGSAPADNLATDGATIEHVATVQLPRAEATDDSVIVTLTAGGNNLLTMLDHPAPPRNFAEILIRQFDALVGEIRQKFGAALIVLSTIYDPSDGSGVLYGRPYHEPLQWLHELNEAVRQKAARTPGCALADIHRHFLGHGASASPLDRWYWEGLIFEPNARGASEVRRLWLDALARQYS
jgi:lysophospholipase L1-like esterase